MVAKSRKRKTEEAGAAQPARPPMPNWTISVRDFGRVASADIEMAPMVVLVGKNNTGKSYIASLLWAMMNADEFLFRNEVELGGLSKSTHALAAKLEKLAKKANWTKSEQISPVEDHLFDGSLFYLNELMGDKKMKFSKDYSLMHRMLVRFN